MCRRVASIVLVPQKEPGAGQRCVLSDEKTEIIKEKMTEMAKRYLVFEGYLPHTP